MVRGVVCVFGVALAARAAHAQSININFGPPAAKPSATYAAAGLAGSWNTVTGTSGPVYNGFVSIDGSATSIEMTQSPTTTLLNAVDPSVTGDDAKLLDNGLDTTGAETCLMFSGFAPGTYEVLIYAWTPNQPTVLSRTRQDEAPSTKDVGGAWTGQHVEGVTYARYTVTVDSSGNLPAHSGLAPNQPSAALNGVQIRLMTDAAPDAGPGGGGATPDGGAQSPEHQNGCAAGGDGAGLAMLGVVLLVLRRRRERAPKVEAAEAFRASAG
jgi:MYXO-CTERM domain-containing protein